METYYVITWDMQNVIKEQAETFSEISEKYPNALYIASKMTMQTLKDQIDHFKELK